MIRLRVLIDTGNQRSPDMAQVDSGTDGVVRTVIFPFIGILRLKRLFRRERTGQFPIIRERVGDTPSHVGLLDVGERVSLEMMFFMP